MEKPPLNQRGLLSVLGLMSIAGQIGNVSKLYLKNLFTSSLMVL